MQPYEQTPAAGQPAASAVPAPPDAAPGEQEQAAPSDYGMTPPSSYQAPAEPQVIQTDTHSQDGLVKCLRCGATEISLNSATGKLRCSFCRFEWATDSVSESLNLNTDIGTLTGVMVGSGAADITPSTEEIL